MNLQSKLVGVLSLCVAAGLSSAVSAATTPVLTPSNGEMHLIDILGQAYGYGGSPTGTIGTTVSYTNGSNSILFTRISDSGGAPGNLLLNGSALTRNDATWQDGSPTFNVEAKYAGLNQVFGWKNLNTATNQDLLSISTGGLNPGYTTINSVANLSNNFLWYDTAGGNTWYSDPSLNGGSNDHMVTFWATGTTASGGLLNGGLGAFVIAFEDLPFASSDKDYNDLVLQVSQIPGGGTPNIPVPLPAAVWGGMSMLGALGVGRMIKRRRA